MGKPSSNFHSGNHSENVSSGGSGPARENLQVNSNSNSPVMDETRGDIDTKPLDHAGGGQRPQINLPSASTQIRSL